MKAAAHIVFKFKKDRIAYLQSIIKEFEKYPFFVDVFIHSDKKLDTNLTFDQYSNGKIILKKLNLRKYFIYKGWKYRLAFSARKLLAKQKDEYDIFIYLEDDILIPKEAIDYWLTYKDLCISQNYNLGFLRVEKKNGEEYLTDLTIKLNKTLKIDDNKFIINDKSPYSAFWIYDKDEFKKWVESDLYNLKIVHGYGKSSRVLKILRLSWSTNLQYLIYDWQHKRIDSLLEVSAYGLIYPKLDWYKETIIKLDTNHIDYACRVYHLSNTYVNEQKTDLGTLKIKEMLDII